MTMTRRFAAALLALTLAACAADTREPVPDEGTPMDSAVEQTGAEGDTTVAQEPQPDDTTMTPDGWGPLRIGMTRAEVVAAAGEDANPDAVGGPEPEVCDEFRPRSAPEGLLVMIERGVLTRISLSRNAPVRTPEGIGLGDPATRVMEVHGAAAVVESHKYVAEPARYITVWREGAGEERRGVRYEIGADGNVQHIRAGGSSIELVEGCL